MEYLDADNRSEALAEHILLLRPDDPTAHAILAEIDSGKANCRDAVGHFQQAGKILDDQPRALSAYGVCLANLNRFNEAIPVFQRLVDLEPNKSNSLYNLALIQWKSNKADDAIGILDALVQGTNPDVSALMLDADIHESKGDTQQAIELLRNAIKSHPKNKDAYLDFANLSANHSSFSVGIDMLNIGLRYLPTQSELYLARGVLYCQLRRYKAKALLIFKPRNHLNPKLSFPGIAEGIAESQAHKSVEALATFRVQSQKHPDDALAQYLFAEALSEHGVPSSPDDQEEIRAAKLAVKLDPTLQGAHDLLATDYLRAGKTDSAIHSRQEALKIDPNDQQALYHLILAMKKSGNKKDVDVLVERLLRVRRTRIRLRRKTASAASDHRITHHIPFTGARALASCLLDLGSFGVPRVTGKRESGGNPGSARANAVRWKQQPSPPRAGAGVRAG